MKKIIFAIFLMFLIFSIIGVYAAGSDVVKSEFSLLGCEDKTLPNLCSSSTNYGIPYYCTDKFLLTPQCTKCGCPPTNALLRIWCNPATNNCSEAPNVKCGEQDIEECKTYLGVCFIKDNSECESCPDRMYNITACSFYTNQNSCEEDMCFLGKTSLGARFYESESAIANYSCEWYDESCQLAYSTINPETGNTARCRTTQKLGPCINDKAQLDWTRECDADTELPTATSGTTNVACGKAVSPLPFFNASNFIVVLAFLFVYYFVSHAARLKSNKRKEEK